MLKKIKKKLNRVKRKFLPALTASLGNFFLKCILKTCHIKINGLDHLLHQIHTGNLIVMVWHNRLTPIVHLLQYLPDDVQCAALISNSRDGELLTKLIEKYPRLHAIRVAHHSRHNALKEAIETLNTRKKTVIVITPDGPRGPRYQIKPGIAMAAQYAAAPIIPLSWASTSFWQLNSWDKMMFPKPFSTIFFNFGAPIKTDEQDLSIQLKNWELILKDLDHATAADVLKNPLKWPK